MSPAVIYRYGGATVGRVHTGLLPTRLGLTKALPPNARAVPNTGKLDDPHYALSKPLGFVGGGKVQGGFGDGYTLDGARYSCVLQTATSTLSLSKGEVTQSGWRRL